ARVWNSDGSGAPIVLRGHEDVVTCAAFSPDGTRVVTASKDKTARVWNADGTGQPLVLRGHESRLNTAQFSPDGTRIITVARDKTARVWDADRGGSPLFVYKDVVTAGALGGGGAFDQTGARIVTITGDKAIQVHSADGSDPPIRIRVPEIDPWSVALSPDGTRIVSASHGERITTPTGAVEVEHTVKVWTDLRPLSGPDDSALWTATTFCPTVEQRMDLLDASEERARQALAACQRRVAAARAGPAE
ncbi:MAG: protein kinase, partial [Myxococcota bacterium]